jgi:hypothetical protein
MVSMSSDEAPSEHKFEATCSRRDGEDWLSVCVRTASRKVLNIIRRICCGCVPPSSARGWPRSECAASGSAEVSRRAHVRTSKHAHMRSDESANVVARRKQRRPGAIMDPPWTTPFEEKGGEVDGRGSTGWEANSAAASTTRPCTAARWCKGEGWGSGGAIQVIRQECARRDEEDLQASSGRPTGHYCSEHYHRRDPVCELRWCTWR